MEDSSTTEEKRAIFPAEVVSYSVEKHFSEYNPRTNKLYLTLIGLFFAAILLMFIVKVDISVRSTGMIRSINEKDELKSPVNGVIDSVFITENMSVKPGQVLFKIKNQSVDQQNIALNTQQGELENQVADLEKLVAGNTTGLKSQVYQQQYMLYKQKLADASLRYNVANRNYQRYATLYRKKVIAPAEFDKYDFDRKSAASDLQLVKEQQFTQWQASYTTLKQQLENTKANLSVYGEQKDLYTVRSPSKGSIQKLRGLQPGTVVTMNDVLGEISPDSGMIVEAYVLPKDIGLLQKNTVVRMQVDAFNYNEWGAVTGKVTEISNDIYTGNGQPYFKVRCSLDKMNLQLKNGYKGNLRKGMSVQARFLVTKRSLFQLLHDKTEDWLNPNLITSNNDQAKN